MTISQHLTQTADAILSTYRTQHTAITNAVNLIRQCRDNGGTVYVAGNGGSSSTAAHFCNDLQKAYDVPAVDLMSNTALLTAYANDNAYDEALGLILERLYDIDDVIVLISVSGDSPNIVNVAKQYYPNGHRIIGLGSRRRGRLAKLATVFIEAQSESMTVSESVHLAVCHAIVEALI